VSGLALPQQGQVVSPALPGIQGEDMSDKAAFLENLQRGGQLTDDQRQENIVRGLIAIADQLDRIERRQTLLQQEVELVRDIARRVRN
jgi:hypothetical protein